MNVLTKLSSSLNRHDEVPNQELAAAIAKATDKKAVKELVVNLSNKNKQIQSDCIKVLYEIGERKPEMIAPYCTDFGKLLDSNNNRLVWGAMTALDTVASANPKGVYKLLPQIIATADSGSVITRDHAVGILAKLGTSKPYAAACFPLMIEQLKKSPNNQLPMYAEKAIAIVNDRNKAEFVKVISSRLATLEKESQKKRVEKLLMKLSK